MPTPRLPLLAAEHATATAAEVGIVEPKARSSLYRTLLHQPQLAKRISDLIDTLMTDADLSHRLRELIIMRIGWSNNGVYEWTQHWRIAQGFGVDERDLLATRDWHGHDHWSAADRAALRATDETLADGRIAPDTWDDCVRLFPTERERLELVATIGSWKMMSEILQSLEVPLEDGVAPWPPDGVTPNDDEHEETTT